MKLCHVMNRIDSKITNAVLGPKIRKLYNIKPERYRRFNWSESSSLIVLGFQFILTLT